MKGTVAFGVFALAALLLATPVFAANADAAASAEAEAATASRAEVSMWDLRLRGMGEAFSDFVFNVRSFLTFESSSKVNLLMERNAELKARQEAWLDVKAEALADMRSGNLTAAEKQEVNSFLKAEHEAIIREHIRTTSEIREIQLAAKASGDATLEAKAEANAETAEDSGLSLGLNVPVDGHIGVGIGTNMRAEAMTAAEAEAFVESRLGLEATGVRTEVRNGETVHVVSGTETEVIGGYRLDKSFEAVVVADTGIVTSVSFGTDIVSISLGTNSGAQVNTNAGAAINTETSAVAGAGTQAQAGSSTGAASGSASGEAGGSAGVGVGTGTQANAGSRTGVTMGLGA